MKYKYILFDLDGTVSQSAEGIRASLEYSLSCLGVEPPDLDDYTKYIGPPLLDTFRNLCGLDEEDADRGAEIYRSYYNEHGKRMNRAYDGVRELLTALKELGAKTAVCTSKYEPHAAEILEILGLRDMFNAVCGSNIDGSRKDKKDLIPYAVSSLGGVFPQDAKNAVMLGDTWFDAQGARLCGVDFIGVTYGYGSLEAMRGQGAEVFADSSEELLTLLR